MKTPRLTLRQSAIISAYTGFLAGPFAELQKYAEEILDRPVWTHQMGSESFSTELRNAAKEDFLSICAED